MSDKPKKLPSHIRVGIFTSEPIVIYHQTCINEDVDITEKESMEDNQLELKTHNTLTVHKHATVKGMFIDYPSKSLTSIIKQQ